MDIFSVPTKKVVGRTSRRNSTGKGSYAINTKNDIDAVMDVAIKEGRIAEVAKNIDGNTQCRW